jgi:predicted CoA-binding protein
VQTIEEMIRESKVIAVVGLSPDPDRPSNEVSVYMQENGYRIIPVNPRYAGQTILGELCYPDLQSVPEPIDLVDVFRRPEFTPPVARDAVAVGAKAFWLQLGIVNEEAASIARAAGLGVVMDRCTRIEHARMQREGVI